MLSISKSALTAAVAVVALVGTIGVAGHSRPASAQPAPSSKQDNQCFYRRNINGFSAPNDRTLYIRVGVHDIFRLDLMSDCTGLTFREDIGISDEPGGDPFICSPLQATITYREGGIRDRCPVTAMHRLTPEEIAAIPKKNLP